MEMTKKNTSIYPLDCMEDHMEKKVYLFVCVRFKGLSLNVKSKKEEVEITSIFSTTATDAVTVSHLTSSTNLVTSFSSCRPIEFFGIGTSANQPSRAWKFSHLRFSRVVVKKIWHFLALAHE